MVQVRVQRAQAGCSMTNAVRVCQGSDGSASACCKAEARVRISARYPRGGPLPSVLVSNEEIKSVLDEQYTVHKIQYVCFINVK